MAHDQDPLSEDTVAPQVAVRRLEHTIEYMSDLPPSERLAKHRSLETWLVWQLRQTRREIGSLEQQMRTAPGYVAEKTVRKGHPLGATVHVAGCTTIRRETRPLSATDARTALGKDRKFFSACDFCAPAGALNLGN